MNSLSAPIGHWIGTGVAPVNLVGHSMGGVLGLEWLEADAARVAGFVNIDGNVSISDCAFSGRAVESGLDAFVAEGFDRLRDGIYRDGAEDPALRAAAVEDLGALGPGCASRFEPPLRRHLRDEAAAVRRAAVRAASISLRGSPLWSIRRETVAGRGQRRGVAKK